MNPELLNDIANVILLTSVPALALFVGFYYFKSPWRKLLVGRSLMYFAMSLLLIVATVSLSIWLGPNYPGRGFVRIFAYSLLSFTTWRLFLTLRRIQRDPPPVEAKIGLAEVTEDQILQMASEIIDKREAGDVPDSDKLI